MEATQVHGIQTAGKAPSANQVPRTAKCTETDNTWVACSTNTRSVHAITIDRNAPKRDRKQVHAHAYWLRTPAFAFRAVSTAHPFPLSLHYIRPTL